MKSSLKLLKSQTSLPPEIFDYIAGEFLEFSPGQLAHHFPSIELEGEQLIKFQKLLDQAQTGTPPQYIFKKAYFHGREFYVDNRVLIPRPETELLVEQAVEFLELRIKNKESGKIRVLDLGTGSGCIAISIYKSLPPAPLSPVIVASDISLAALKIAKKNATSHKANIEFIQSDLFEDIQGKFDLICANLPYIGPGDKDLENLKDPKLALIANQQGFELIDKSIRSLDEHLSQNSLALFEIGYNHTEPLLALAKELGLKARVIKDFTGYTRIGLITRD